MVTGRSLTGGTGSGPLLRLRQPISFWGGIDPRAGTIADPRHSDFGASVRARVLAIPALVGSSSSSAIMLELLREGTAPAAILLGGSDAILPLGVVVARELGYAPIPIVEMPMAALNGVADGTRIDVRDGVVTIADR